MNIFGRSLIPNCPIILGFVIEIEAVVEPWKFRPQWRDSPEKYYERLAFALRNRGRHAVADTLSSAWQPQHAEHYDSWFITKDGSLQSEFNQNGLEAVSPIMNIAENWMEELDLFWEAMSIVFRVQRNFSCGSHVHAAPHGRRWSIYELKIIAYAIITQEHLIEAFLTNERRGNQYCRNNSEVSGYMIDFFANGKSAFLFSQVRDSVRQIDQYLQIRNLMHGDDSPDSRYVLWNFQNIMGGSGTIEFRGGRHLRGPNRSKWLITFVVAYISLALKQNLLNDPSAIIPQYYCDTDSLSEVYAGTQNVYQYCFLVSQLWKDIRDEA